MSYPLRPSVLIVFLAMLSGTMASAQSIINTYTNVTSVDAPNGVVTVGNPTGFTAGAQVLLIQMQGASIDGSNGPSYGTINRLQGAGRYEFAIVERIEGRRIVFTAPLVNSDYRVEGKVQLITVPEYEDLSIVDPLTCKPWGDDGTGGVLVLSASCVIMDNDIDVSGKGFRGGPEMQGTCVRPNEAVYIGLTTECWWGPKGEGIAGFGIAPYLRARGAPANAGGGGNNHNGGAGGGGNGGAGGRGGQGYAPLGGQVTDVGGIGGQSLISWYRNPERLFMGGGGGTGHINDQHGSSGANGGGIVIIRAGNITTNGRVIRARGNSAADDDAPENPDGGGGGGAGGTVILDIQSVKGQLTIDVSGGNGASFTVTKTVVGPGGGGGGGFIGITGDESAAATCLRPIVDPGKAGKTLAGDNYGAVDGMAGAVDYAYPLPGVLREHPNCGTEGCEILDARLPVPPTIDSYAQYCENTSFMVLGPDDPIRLVELDTAKSRNVRVRVDLVPPGSSRVSLELIDPTQQGVFHVHIRTQRGHATVIVDTMFGSSNNRLRFTSLPTTTDVYDLEIDSVSTHITCRDVEIMNTSDAPVSIDNAVLLWNLRFSVPPSQFPIVIPPGERKNVRVCFDPRIYGMNRDTLIITDFCPRRIPLAARVGDGEWIGEACSAEVRMRVIHDTALVKISRPEPNPATSTLRVPVIVHAPKGHIAPALRCTLHDLLGNPILDGTYRSTRARSGEAMSETEGEFVVDITRLPSGVYRAVVTGGGGPVSFPVIVTR